MDSNKKKTVLIAFITADLLLAMLLVYLFVGNVNRMSDEELRELGATVYPDPREITPFQLTDHRGNSFTQDALDGSWTLIFFGYTNCPDICPLTMSELDRFYQDLESSGQAQDTNIVLATVDPLNDSPEKMADYVTSFHQDFIGLTGDLASLQQLADDLYVIFSDSSEEQGDEHNHTVNHSAHISVIDPNGNYHSVMRAPHRSADLGIAFEAIRER
jgi:protein SCO1/2